MSDIWQAIRAATDYRVGIGRAGDSMTTDALLDLREAQARARDAVHQPLDVDALVRQLRDAGVGEPVVVHSRAADRSEYLRRPDLGRALTSDIPEHSPVAIRPEPLRSEDARGLPRLGIVVADGLSTAAVSHHGAPMVRALTEELAGDFRIEPVIIAVQARVAIGDEIGAALGLEEVIVLIGERPGLSVSDSLGAYLTHNPVPGTMDSQRNCVSNIRPGGLDYARAAATLGRLARGALVLGRSGVDLKDVGPAVDGAGRPALSEGSPPGR